MAIVLYFRKKKAPASLPPLGDTGGGKRALRSPPPPLPSPVDSAGQSPRGADGGRTCFFSAPAEACPWDGDTATAGDDGCISGPGGRRQGLEVVWERHLWRSRWGCSPAAAWGAAAVGGPDGLSLGRAGHGRCERWPAAWRRFSGRRRLPLHLAVRVRRDMEARGGGAGLVWWAAWLAGLGRCW
jgi:hypothetical protein